MESDPTLAIAALVLGAIGAIAGIISAWVAVRDSPNRSQQRLRFRPLPAGALCGAVGAAALLLAIQLQGETRDYSAFDYAGAFALFWCIITFYLGCVFQSAVHVVDIVRQVAKWVSSVVFTRE